MNSHRIRLHLFRGIFIVAVFTGGFATGYFSEKFSLRPKSTRMDSVSDTTVSIFVDREPFMGKEKAPVVMVLFSDYQCPYSKKFWSEIKDPIKKYIKSGHVKLVHKDRPLSSEQNGLSFQTALMARCSGDNYSFWDIYNAFFDNQRCLGCVGPSNILASIGVNKKRIDECLQRGDKVKTVSFNISEANLLGVHSTPSIIIGSQISSEAGVLKGKVFEGMRSWNEVEHLIIKHLEES